MAKNPTVEEMERFVLDVFKEFGTREEEVLRVNTFHGKLAPKRYRTSDLQVGLESLSKKGMVRVENFNVILTKLGFEAV